MIDNKGSNNIIDDIINNNLTNDNDKLKNTTIDDKYINDNIDEKNTTIDDKGNNKNIDDTIRIILMNRKVLR